MNFQRFVQRSTKGVFLFIVVVMVLSLVLWGYMGSGTGRGAGGDAGIIFGTVHVSMDQWRRHQNKATPAWWWRQYNDPQKIYLAMTGQLTPPAEEEIDRLAWENVILLEDARAKGITATRSEADLEIRDRYFHQVTLGRLPLNTEILERVASGAFHCPLGVFEDWAADQVVIDKLLDLVEKAEFADYARAYEEALKDRRMARLWIAAANPRDYARDLQPVRSEEIARYYNDRKARFKVSEKIQTAYLMIDYDSLQKKYSDPGELEMRQYFEEHKDEFRRPPGEHRHESAETHRDDEPPQYKNYEEVRSEVPDRIKREKARKEALELAARVDKAIGSTAKDGKYPEDVFDQVQSRFTREGTHLLYDITSPFDLKHVDDVEKIVGKDSDLSEWGFDGRTKEGDISKWDETDKGVLFYRLQKKRPAYEPGLTEPVRERIVKELQREHLRRRAQWVASNVVQEINLRGLGAARRRYPGIEWTATRYFRLDRGDPGIAESGLSRQVVHMITSGQLKADHPAATFDGATSVPEKRDWTYAAYLEDMVDGVPEDVEGAFHGARSRLEAQARRDFRGKYVSEIVQLADLQDSRDKERKPPPQP